MANVFVLYVRILEQLIERDLGFLDTPVLVGVIENKNPAKGHLLAKFSHLTKDSQTAIFCTSAKNIRMAKMSSKMWYATAVWHELIKVNSSDDVMGGHRTYRTVSSVASGAGVSRMTARKYLEGFVSEKHAVKIGQGKTVMYGVNHEVYG